MFGSFLDKIEKFLNAQSDRIATILILTLIVFSIGFLVSDIYKLMETKAKTEIVEVIEAVTHKDVSDLAKANGFDVSFRVTDAILKASKQYDVDAYELTAIGIVETGLGKYARTRKNKDGTIDKGIFQINTVNHAKCVEYNLESPEGSALCAAKLLAEIRTKRNDYLGVYHSKTPSKKAKYLQKIAKVLASTSDR